MRPFLSICIPTFQRKESLKKLLGHLVRAIEKYRLRDEVEVVISDNASSDRTYEMLMVYAKDKNFLKIRRNHKNLGCDKNIINVLTEARGEYCWLINDHAPIVFHNFSYFIDFLKEQQDFICGLIIPAEKQLKLGKRFVKERYMNDEFIEEYINYVKNSNESDISLLGYINCFIFKRSLIKKIKKRLIKEKNYYYWAHLTIFLYLISRFKGSIIVYKEPWIIDDKQKKLYTELNYKVFLPHEIIKTFYYNRKKAISVFPISQKLKKALIKKLDEQLYWSYIK
ncbi:MAG: glycosyltransferase, partial [Candidatus Anstonellales archaeon]